MQPRALQAPFIRLFATALALAAGFLFAPAAYAGSADNVTGWAWSGSIGWISMNCTNNASCGTVNFGVTIDDKPGFGDRGDLKGYAWSETLGWICFGLTCSGTTPEGGAPYAEYRANFNGKTDQFWGWAQVLSMGSEGWISLNCDHDAGPDDCASSNSYVLLNNANGNFTAGAANDHWGWGVNTSGVGTGWIDFSIVNTSWVLARLGVILRPQGVFEPNTAFSAFACTTDADCSTHAPYTQCEKVLSSFACASVLDCSTHAPYLRCDTPSGTCMTTDKCMLPGTHMGRKFSITFNNFSGALNQFLECEISLPDLSKRIVNRVLSLAIRNSTTTLDYTIVGGDSLQSNRIWYLDVCRIAGSALGAACANDAACGVNKICDENAGKCRDVIEQSNKRRPIYTHDNAWTGLDASQDQYLAIKCNAGFPNNYFKNAAQCDFTGDASFSLAMRRGIPVEGDCGDFIDNDGNGQVDCADRYCKGISYRCQTLKKTSCVYGQAADGMNDCTDVGYANGELCCTRQPLLTNPALDHVVDGLECTHGDVEDGYFDCDCAAGQFGTYADCYSPGYQAGDLCCDATNQVVKQ
ncbi:MAG TPA: hypothetical protein VL500_01950 [Candidatus Eisenbacteria bacterium]|nr:hypothetical protein [Candidatus Eisenbacteria bacterium]